MLQKLSFALLFAVLTYGQIASAEISLRGKCPKVKLPNEFNWADLEGYWYEHSRFQDSFEDGIICVIQAISTNNIKIFGDLLGVDVWSNTTVFFRDDASIVQPNIYIVTFEKRDPGSDKFIKQGLTRKNIILGTDPKSWMTVFNCVENQHEHIEKAQIFTRERHPNAETVKKAEAALAQNNISRRFLVATRQRNCPKKI